MVEVFITNVQSKIQAEDILDAIQNADLKINFDLNETDLPFLVDIQFYELKVAKSIRKTSWRKSMT